MPNTPIPSGGGYAGCRILDAPFHADREYTYRIPFDLTPDIAPGVFVTVPFGGGNRARGAVVTSVFSKSEHEDCKPILDVANRGVTLGDEFLGLCEFLCEHTLCTFGEAVRAAVPRAALSRSRDSYTVTEKAPQITQPSSTLRLYSFIRMSEEPVPEERIIAEFGEADAKKLLASLVKTGCLRRVASVREPTNKRVETVVALAVSKKEAEDYAADAQVRSKRCRDIMGFLADTGKAAASELKDALGPVAPQLKKLAAAGLVTLSERRVMRNPFADVPVDKAPPVLSPAQDRAFQTLLSLFRSGEPKAALLYGVTGSGKTSVIRAMIDAVTAEGRGVIILVPEISLTPQTVSIFCGSYGSRVAVIHSSLSEGERLDAWERARSGEADIVIGTRSAIFAPVKSLGMIVIDEEQEHTYKSDKSPKYLAHDVARYRCSKNGALMLLSSATPSMSSFYKSKNNAYTLVPLTERYGGASLPAVTVADMREDRADGSASPLGSVLRSAIKETLSRGEQAILFLNRRGYNNFLSCRKCGEAVRCPRCSVALTYHTTRRLNDTENPEDYRAEHISGGRLVCHYCGYRAPAPEKCPSCGGENLFYMGWGTQRVEQELTTLFPEARVLRMDADTTRTRASYDEILGAFGRGEADILLGTQMVTKGHDFPSVTLVGVLLAESSLFLDDYRASERTFSMITQAVGRAGRASLPGRAVIQTYTPDNACLGYACRQDYEGFYSNEIRLRRAYMFPPYCDIAQITLSSLDESELSTCMLRLTEEIKSLCSDRYSDVPLVMFGPFEAPVYRVNGRYRMRVVCKCRLSRRTRALFAEIMRAFSRGLTRRVTISIDFNPTSI